MALCLGMGSMAQAADGHFGADRHVARGLTCESCHGKNMDMKNPEIPTIETCTGCHNTKDGREDQGCETQGCETH